MKQLKGTLNKPSAAEQRIFCPIRAVQKTGNTSSITVFSELSPESKSLAVSSCRFNHRSLEKVANAYCKAVAAAIPVHGKKRTEYLHNLRQDAMDYLSTHPWSKADELSKRFGTPEDISIAFVSEMSMDEINERFRARNRVIKIAMAVAALALLLLLAAIAWMLIRNHQDMSGYLVVTG